VATTPIRRPPTYDDIVRLPEHLIGEIVDGELYVSPRPAIPHAVAGSTLAGDLSGPFQRGRGGPGGWWILFEPELHFGVDVLVPDLAGWRRERLPRPPKAPFLELAPDWICEVLSPSTERLDRARKLRIYARECVAHAWLVNPETRTLEVLRRQGKTWTLLATHEHDDVVRAEPFDAIELDLLGLWGEERPRQHPATRKRAKKPARRAR
jgi:Uma2 family endonuclease